MLIIRTYYEESVIIVVLKSLGKSLIFISSFVVYKQARGILDLVVRGVQNTYLLRAFEGRIILYFFPFLYVQQNFFTIKNACNTLR